MSRSCPHPRKIEEAQLQLAAAPCNTGEVKEARVQAERIIASRHSLEITRGNARWVLAECLGRQGDDAGQRRELEGIVNDYTDEPTLGFIVMRARRILAE